MKRFVFAFLALALAFASAKTYTLTLVEPSTVGGTELKPGECTLALEGSRVIVSQGKQKAESTVKVENADTKFNGTSIRYANENGRHKVQEIRLGGTNLKLIFD